MYLFFDTETTGLPRDYNAPVSHTDNRPRMVQIARFLYDEKKNIINEKNYIIKPEGYEIPLESSRVHGITTAIAQKKGKNLKKVLGEFAKDMKKSNFLVAHNISFDEKIIGAEFYRKEIKNIINQKILVCTMKQGVDICQIPKRGGGYKRPTLQELHQKIFGYGFDGAHDALNDIRACADCFWQMNKDNSTCKDKAMPCLNKEKKKPCKDAIDRVSPKHPKNSREDKALPYLNKDISFDPIATSALEMMESGDKNIFLTGKAGTGKSTLLRHFIENTKKTLAILAPTGVAALNVGGSTIHSFFKFSPTITYNEAERDARRSLGKQLFTELETVIIDEISMVRSDMVDCIDVFLRIVRKSDLPFGGVQMIWIGDLYQLPPVVSSRERDFFSSEYQSPYFFDAKVFQNPLFNIEFIELQKIYRQSDQKFIDILNAIRNKTVDDSHIDHLNMNVVGDKYEINDGNMILTGINAKADSINQTQLDKLKGKSHKFKANVKGKISERQYPTESILELKVDAQVMFLANDILGEWVNGTVGKITKIEDDEIEVQIYGGDLVAVSPHTWNVKQYVYQDGKLGSEVVGTFTQLPIMLAWAITIHKSQGKTFEKLIIDLGSGIFAHGQTYVALSRCTGLEGLSLVSPIKKSHVILDRKVVDFVTKISIRENI